MGKMESTGSRSPAGGRVDMSLDRHHRGFQVLIIVWDGTRLMLVDECSNFLVGLNTELRSIFNPEDGMGVRGATSLELDPDHVAV